MRVILKTLANYCRAIGLVQFQIPDLREMPVQWLTTRFSNCAQCDGGSWSTLMFHFGTAEHPRGILLPANGAASARGPATSATPASVACVCLCTPVLWAKGATPRTRQQPRPSYCALFLAPAFALALALAGTAANFATGRFFCPACGARTARTAAPRTTAASGAAGILAGEWMDKTFSTAP